MRPERKSTEDDDRFKELVLYVCEKCVADPRFGATKLNKILYFADFLAYAESGEPITGMEYRENLNGPARRRLLPSARRWSRTENLQYSVSSSSAGASRNDP